MRRRLGCSPLRRHRRMVARERREFGVDRFTPQFQGKPWVDGMEIIHVYAPPRPPWGVRQAGEGDRGAHGEQGAGPLRRSRTASRTSTQDMSSSKHGGQRSHSGIGGPTRDQLYNEARQRNVKGRSTMTKAELSKALGRQQAHPPPASRAGRRQWCEDDRGRRV